MVGRRVLWPPHESHLHDNAARCVGTMEIASSAQSSVRAAGCSHRVRYSALAGVGARGRRGITFTDVVLDASAPRPGECTLENGTGRDDAGAFAREFPVQNSLTQKR